MPPSGAWSGVSQDESRNLEFLVVCSDYQKMKTTLSVVQKLGGRVDCVPSAESARGYIARRKLDGIMVDAQIPGARELIEGIRKGNSNKLCVIFAFVPGKDEVHQIVQAGANFMLHDPLTPEKLMQAFSAASSMMIAERRRYFRHALMIPVALKVGDQESKGTMSNLSEAGMAVWCVTQYAPGSPVEFSFELPFGGLIKGKGEIAWTNTEGLMGIRFHLLHENAYAHLSTWLTRREVKSAAERKL